MAAKARKAKAPEETPVQTEKADTPQPSPSSCPIVGIGASAGGLAAFEAFFSGMPTDTDPGMAFVLVQHLAPDHKSILTELIRRYTRMQVFEVEDGMVVQPNCAYIIPPNRDMAFLNGALQLMEPSAPRGQRLPIDFFFRSLAQDQHERAICIVLSGTGSDGTLGVRAIKGGGGMVMVQNPDSTEYDGMPRNALATGMVDYELPPAEMAAQLIAYVAHAFHKPRQAATAPEPKSENAMKKIFILLRAQTGHDFSQYKPSTVHRRIERRLAVHQIGSVEEYVKYLQQTTAEVDALFRDLLIGVTNFFRDPAVFQTFQEQVLPKIFAGKPAGAAIRVWTPGCSTGEEAYSIAILLTERQEAMKRFQLQVFASDIDNQAIATARAGLYPASIAADITTERLARYFTPEPDGSAYRVHKDIRDLIVFSEQDLIKDPPFSKLDLVVCRNLLIYMGADLQKKLIPLLHYALNPGGFLFLGTSETVGEFGHLFSPVDRKAKLYRREEDVSGTQRLAIGRFLPPILALEKQVQPTAGRLAGGAKQGLRELTEQALLQQVAPAGALVNGKGDILYLHGRTGLYLEPAPGEAGINNVLKMAREGLRRGLTTALHQAAGKTGIVRSPGLRVKTNGAFTTVNVTIRPVAADLVEPPLLPLYLVIFEDEPPPNSEIEEKAALPAVLEAESSGDARVAALQQELRAKEEFLQTAHEELETSNEELKSSNEEMQSVNEELQSTNEELETSKEELQSLNEELSTVNAELQNKLADLSRANNDMNNLLAGTGIGTVFVDHQLRILRFTPAATRIINLIASDVGRPVHHILSNLTGYDNLPADVQTVLDTLIPKEVEVQTRAEEWYSMRILPYRTQDHVIEGAVITFVDISAAKQTQDALARTERLNWAILEGLAGSFLSLDNDLMIKYFHPAAERMLNRDAQGVIGRLLSDAFPEMRGSVLEERCVHCARSQTALSFEAQLGSASPADWYDVDVHPEEGGGIAVLIHPITRRKLAEEALRESEARYRVLFESMTRGAVFHSLDGEILDANPAAARILGLRLDRMRDSESNYVRWQAVHEDGSDWKKNEHPVLTAVRTGLETRDTILGLHPPNGAGTIWIRISAIPQFKDGERTPHQVLTIFDDFTGRLSSAKAGQPQVVPPRDKQEDDPLDQQEQ